MQFREMTIADYGVYRTNGHGAGFWKAAGWYGRDDLQVMSHDTVRSPPE